MDTTNISALNDERPIKTIVYGDELNTRWEVGLFDVTKITPYTEQNGDLFYAVWDGDGIMARVPLNEVTVMYI